MHGSSVTTDEAETHRGIVVNLDSPDTWRWIWLVMAGVFAVSEIATAATFFFLPFAVGALVASGLCFAGVSVFLSFAIFLVVSVVAFGGFWRLGRRFDRNDVEQEGVGATRWVGQEARVIADIKAGGIGTVLLEREEWRAESLTGAAIRKGSTVVITRITGLRLVVVPVDEPIEEFPAPPTLGPSSSGSGNS